MTGIDALLNMLHIIIDIDIDIIDTLDAADAIKFKYFVVTTGVQP